MNIQTNAKDHPRVLEYKAGGNLRPHTQFCEKSRRRAHKDDAYNAYTSRLQILQQSERGKCACAERATAAFIFLI